MSSRDEQFLESTPGARHAEFDDYANGYDAGMDNPIARVVGNSADDFMNVKIDWLVSDLNRRPIGGVGDLGSLRLLDYGCGTGTFLKNLYRRCPNADIRGCDISAEMIGEGIRNWETGPVPQFDVLTGEQLPYEDNSFKIVVTCAVLHHVPIDQRAAIYQEASRVLAPGGRFYIFEHNPYNPLTAYVVRKTPIDANAILLTASECERGMDAAGLDDLMTRYLMFFPPRWKWPRRLESRIGRLPLGGQYVTVGQKPNTNEIFGQQRANFPQSVAA